MGMVKAVTQLSDEQCTPGEIATKLGLDLKAVCGVLGRSNCYRQGIIRLWHEGCMPEIIAGKLGIDLEAVEMVIDDRSNYPGTGMRGGGK